MIKVTNEVPIYLDSGSTTETVTVRSHWNYDDRVILKIGDKEAVVIGRDLTAAIANAMNTRRF